MFSALGEYRESEKAMTDWADELIFAGIDAETLRRIERKAKADGMREAAKEAERWNGIGKDIAAVIRAQASYMEQNDE